MPHKTKLLFICSGNINRSPTAEALFKNSERYEARSAGTNPLAVKQVNQELIGWADIIFVMSEREDCHLTFLQENFSVSGKTIYDLDIADRYARNDPKLVNLLKEKIGKYLPRADY